MKGPKADNIEKMFDSISSDYDHLNHLLSLDVDKIWRRRALKEIIEPGKAQNILDVACGTGDFSIAIAKHCSQGSVVRGVDMSQGMLSVMSEKVHKLNLDRQITAVQGNCEHLDFPDNSFDVVSIGFGIRNFENREMCLREILRVLKPGGKLVILELSVPSIPVVKQLYNLYFLKVLPLIGGMISGDRSAYNYLPASVLKFPGKKEWMATMSSCGYTEVRHRAFSLGICRMYVGVKSS